MTYKMCAKLLLFVTILLPLNSWAFTISEFICNVDNSENGPLWNPKVNELSLFSLCEGEIHLRIALGMAQTSDLEVGLAISTLGPSLNPHQMDQHSKKDVQILSDNILISKGKNKLEINSCISSYFKPNRRLRSH